MIKNKLIILIPLTDQFIQHCVDYALFLIDSPSQEMFNYIYSNILCEKSQIDIFPTIFSRHFKCAKV
jgi:hypothetical protein